MASRPQFALLKVDIGDWSSPVARQFNLNSIPHIKVYDDRGNILADNDTARQYLQKNQ